MNNNPQNPENPEKKPFDRAEYNRNYQKEYRKKNIEKKKAYDKQYREAHKEESKAYGKQYREEHKEEAKEYREKNVEETKVYQKEYREKNSEKLKQDQKNKYHADIEKSREQSRERNRRSSKKYRETHPDRPRNNQKKFRENNKPKCRRQHSNWWKKKFHSDPLFRLLHNSRNRICEILKCQNIKKNQTFVELIGCTPEFLKSYLESKFTEGMTWENYGYKGWHVDHIIPCSSFDLSDSEQLKKCFHYTNLQPLWWLDNIKKSDKIL